jgi:UDPglucose 6-dehydrogenase
MNITVVGCGYVGLVSASCLAELGHNVVCIDTDEAKLKLLLQAKCPIYEPGLEGLLQRNIERNRLSFVSDFAGAVSKAEVVFITVGTPISHRGNGYADMSYVYEAAQSIAPHIKNYTVVVNKSTVPIGSARKVSRIIKDSNPNAGFDVASNPEFLMEGAAVYDFMHPDRIVLGVDSHRAEKVLKHVYEPLYLIETPFVVTTPETAEIIKYASNAFLATKISFINEIANLSEAIGADIQDIAKGMGLDGRIGPKFLHAGPGFGGSCLPKDTMALVRIAQDHGVTCHIAETVVKVNDSQKVHMVNKIWKALGGEGEAGKVLAVLGLTFKPETDDMREAPSLTILPALLEKGIKIKAYDPAGMDEARKYLSGIEYVNDPYAACENADGVCLMTEWNSFRALDLQRLKRLLKQAVFIDLRNVYRPQAMLEAGFTYVSVGRKNSNGSK